jgi:hypothetical protein
MKASSVVFLLVCIAAAGCAAAPTRQDMDMADYGSYPDNYRKIVMHYISNRLPDPSSAVYSNWSGPTKGARSSFGRLYFGYQVCVWVNPKYLMGAEPWCLMINNEKVIWYDRMYPKTFFPKQ